MLHDARVLGSGEAVAALLSEEEARRGAAAVTAEERREAIGKLIERACALSG
jgi:hypothetical protein